MGLPQFKEEEAWSLETNVPRAPGGNPRPDVPRGKVGFQARCGGWAQPLQSLSYLLDSVLPLLHTQIGICSAVETRKLPPLVSPGLH